MPRKPEVDAPVKLTLMLPTSTRARLDFHLFSELEGRVPLGAYRDFFIARIREFFDSKRLDLAPYGFPQGYAVYGPKDIVEALELRLRHEVKPDPTMYTAGHGG